MQHTALQTDKLLSPKIVYRVCRRLQRLLIKPSHTNTAQRSRTSNSPEQPTPTVSHGRIGIVW